LWVSSGGGWRIIGDNTCVASFLVEASTIKADKKSYLLHNNTGVGDWWVRYCCHKERIDLHLNQHILSSYMNREIYYS
jgi:hypothetical protein